MQEIHTAQPDKASHETYIQNILLWKLLNLEEKWKLLAEHWTKTSGRRSGRENDWQQTSTAALNGRKHWNTRKSQGKGYGMRILCDKCLGQTDTIVQKFQDIREPPLSIVLESELGTNKTSLERLRRKERTEPWLYLTVKLIFKMGNIAQINLKML